MVSRICSGGRCDLRRALRAVRSRHETQHSDRRRGENIRQTKRTILGNFPRGLAREHVA
jgi:hypothetical protein